MPRRHYRIVPLENAARRAAGLPTLRAAAPTYRVSATRRIVYDILGEGASHGSSTTVGALTVTAAQHPIAEVGYLFAAMSGMAWLTEQIAPGYEWLGGLAGLGGAAWQLRRWQRQA